jgi:hypothetical protein
LIETGGTIVWDGDPISVFLGVPGPAPFKISEEEAARLAPVDRGSEEGGGDTDRPDDDQETREDPLESVA